MSITDAFNSELGQEVKRLREENEEVHAAVIRKQKELMEMRMGMVTEECPDCGAENTFKWSVLRNGYQAFCPKCGFPMMLCSECMIDNDNFCDWNGNKSLCYRMVEGFWKNLEDVPFNEDADGRLVLANDYRFMVGNREMAMFPKGTDREEIWHWFDENHPKGVAYLLYRGENKTGVYFSIEDGNDLQLDIAHTRGDAIRKCKENPEAREVFAFRMIGENHELLSCVFSKDNEGGKEE